MVEKTNIKWLELTDNAILQQLGAFIKETRLSQNKTQQELATAAGVNRSTIVQLENGNSATLISFLLIFLANIRRSFDPLICWIFLFSSTPYRSDDQSYDRPVPLVFSPSRKNSRSAV